MSTKNFHTTLKVNAPPEEALKRISQVNQWWAKKVKGKAEKLNDKFTVDFGETFVDFQISELVPNKKVVWKVLDCNLHWIDNKKEWSGNEVVFEVTPGRSSTKIDFTHIGLVPSAECYEDCEVGWTSHLKESLVQLINNGKGKPE